MPDSRAYREPWLFPAGSTAPSYALRDTTSTVDLSELTLTVTPDGGDAVEVDDVADVLLEDDDGVERMYRVWTLSSELAAALEAADGGWYVFDQGGEPRIVGPVEPDSRGDDRPRHRVSVPFGPARLPFQAVVFGGGGGTGLPDGGDRWQALIRTDDEGSAGWADITFQYASLFEPSEFGEDPDFITGETFTLPFTAPLGHRVFVTGTSNDKDGAYHSTASAGGETTFTRSEAQPLQMANFGKYVGVNADATAASGGPSVYQVAQTSGGEQTPMLHPVGGAKFAESISGLPDGGTTGQILAKASGTDGDYEFVSRNAPDGYAGLDGDGTLPDILMPASIARDSEVTATVSAAIAGARPLRPITVVSDGTTVTQVTATGGVLDYDVAEVEPSNGLRGKIALPPLDEWPNQTFTVVPLPPTDSLIAAQGPSIGHPVETAVEGDPTTLTGSGSDGTGLGVAGWDPSSDTNLAGGVTLVPPAITGAHLHYWPVTAPAAVAQVTVKGFAVTAGSMADVQIGGMLAYADGFPPSSIEGTVTTLNSGGGSTMQGGYDGTTGDIVFTPDTPIEDLTDLAVAFYIAPSGGAPVGPDDLTFDSIEVVAMDGTATVYQGYDSANPDLGVGEMNDDEAGFTHAYPDNPENPDRALVVINQGGESIAVLQAANRWESLVGATPDIDGPLDTATNVAQAVTMANQAFVDIADAGASGVGYTPTNPAHWAWAGSVPTTVGEATDSIAEWITANL